MILNQQLTLTLLDNIERREIDLRDLDDLEAEQHTHRSRRSNKTLPILGGYLTPEELYKKYIEGFNPRGYLRDTNKTKRDIALVAGLCCTGLRIQEMLNVTKEQLHQEQEFLVIRGVKIQKQGTRKVKNRKTGQVTKLEKREKYIDKYCPKTGRLAPFTALFSLYADSIAKGPLFNLNRKNAYLVLKQCTGQYPHYFRSQYCSYLVNETDIPTLAIKGITGHSDVKSLERYSHAEAKRYKGRF